MNDELISALDRILELNRQRYIATQTIRNTTHQSIGCILVPLDEGVKERKVDALNRLFQRNAKKIYREINESRLEVGLPLLQNPFMKGGTTK